MSDLLERSLDDIIGDKPSRERANRGDRVEKNRAPRRSRNTRDSFAPRVEAVSRTRVQGIPDEIETKSGGRPLLRVSNLHPELTNDDVALLFEQVNTLEFCELQFDLMDPNRSTGVAYVQFSSNEGRNNAIAIEKFNRKKAMGRELLVVNARGLAARLSLPERSERRDRSERPMGSSYRPDEARQPRERQPRERKPRERQPREPRVKRGKKTIEELDAELNEYLNQNVAADASQATAPDASNASDAPASFPSTTDGMALD